MLIRHFKKKRIIPLILFSGIGLLFYVITAFSQTALSGFNLEIKNLAEKSRGEVIAQFEDLLANKSLTIDQLFDTFYIPIANTYPQKYKTQYDTLVDQRIQKILDKYLATDRRIIFVVIVDSNGYLPTHNSRYSRPLTGDKEIDSANNRAKRLFNDRTGLAAARNIEPFLLQQYNRDTGEVMYDLSIPISIHGKHWGAVRIGYEK
jgi:methyl-accepting chemotaxis protein